MHPALGDRGIYEELSPQVTTSMPAWLATSPVRLWRSSADPAIYRLVDGVPVAWISATNSVTFDASPPATDADSDGIPDAFDILLGAKKAAINAAHYRSEYRSLSYPGGDVPRDEGVCSDVIVRALRNAGFDLQRMVHEDLKVNPKRYPKVVKPDSNIDHHRVRVLLPWFEHHWQSLPTDGHGTSAVYLPGDIVFFDTLRGPEPDHLGIVTDEVGASGLPLVINNWTDGHRTTAMDLLSTVVVTHRFRVPSASVSVPRDHRGPSATLRRHGLALDDTTTQLLLVTAPTWEHTAGRLHRYERGSAATPWTRVERGIEVRLGRAGLKRGRGMHSSEALTTLEPKREGDGAAPAGVFSLGTAFGPSTQAPKGVTWPWRTASPGDVWVDDPSSTSYNQWRPANSPRQWTSAEDLTMYHLGLVVEHNTTSTAPGFGSAIFLHTSNLERPTAGCTSMIERDLERVLSWLRPQAHPKLAQVAGRVF
jgi:D-alanyl-D-alanine dipeptidase